MPLSESKKLFEKILSEIKPAGVTLAGGEPLLYPYLIEIASFLNQKKIKLGIATNGILLDEGVVRALVNNGVGYFELSLVSARKDSYAYLSQNDRIDKVKNAILAVKKHKARLNISAVITKYNKSEIGEIIDLSFAFSADSISLNRFVPGGRGLENMSDCQITKEDLEDVLHIADKKAKELNFPVNVTIPVESCRIDHSRYPSLNFGTCVCGKDKWVIDPLGNLRTCEQNPEILGNLFETGFSELTELKKTSSFRNKDLCQDCRVCAEYDNCGGGCRILNARQAIRL